MLDVTMPMHQGRELPIFTLREIDLPDLPVWEIGSSHYLVMKVEVIGKRNRKDMMIAPPSDQVKIEGDLQMLNVKTLENTPVDAGSLARKEFQQKHDDIMSGKLK